MEDTQKQNFLDSVKRNIGRPRRYETREDLMKVIQEYFDNTPILDLTGTGLALAVGSKQLLQDYEARPEFSDIIKEAKLIIENSYEHSLKKNGRAGDIFALKNYGWKDKQEIDMHHSGSISLSDLASDEE